MLCAKPEDLKGGLGITQILNRITPNHPHADRLQMNHVRSALNSLARLQHKRKIQPIALSYDTNENKLNVVDTGFLLYMASKDERKDELLNLIGMKR